MQTAGILIGMALNVWISWGALMSYMEGYAVFIDGRISSISHQMVRSSLPFLRNVF